MLNYIWGGMIVVSIIVSVFTGRAEETAAAAVSGADSAVQLCIGLLGIVCLWTGLAKIGEKSGLVKIIAKLFKPIMKIIFPKLDPESVTYGSIVLNITANLLGMGNAATPLGIKAMQELDRENKHRSFPSNEMCTLVIINTASIQLIPATIISLRQMYGSQASGEIILPVWIVSVCALIVGITVSEIMERRKRL